MFVLTLVGEVPLIVVKFTFHTILFFWDDAFYLMIFIVLKQSSHYRKNLEIKAYWAERDWVWNLESEYTIKP